MDIEKIVWIFIPILIGILEITISGILIKKRKTIAEFVIFLIIVLLNGLAIYILVQILNGAWPTYFPHFGIGISTILILIQYGLYKKNGKWT